MGEMMLRCFLLYPNEGVGCEFFSFPNKNETLCCFDCQPVDSAPCRNVARVKATLRELCTAVGLEIVAEGAVSLDRKLAALWQRDCAEKRYKHQCVPEVCGYAFECEAVRAKLKETG